MSSLSSDSMAHYFRGAGSAVLSASSYCAVQLTHYRNEQHANGQDLDGFEKFGRRVVGELGYAALVVASLVEVVARLALGPIVALVGLITYFACDDHEAIVLKVAFLLGAVGAFTSLGNAACSTIALVRNIFERTFEYDSLCTPFTGCMANVQLPDFSA